MLLRARVTLPDRPGALLAVAKALADAGGNIVDIEVLAAGEGRAIDDVVVDLPGAGEDRLREVLAGAGAGVLSARKTVRVTGQRADLDLLQRVAAEPASALATTVSMGAMVFGADWAVSTSATDTKRVQHRSVGSPSALPDGLPAPTGALPRRALLDGRWEVVGIGWSDHHVFLGRDGGPTFLQVELLQLRRVVELARSLAGA
ncbi:MAG TPA: ACT domain-containing protein [Mycobacteriales bacterium]|nr:ACT domain-containing protein [Mycobacteriales bacterium]